MLIIIRGPNNVISIKVKGVYRVINLFIRA